MIVLSRKYAVILLIIFIGFWCYFEVFREKPVVVEEEIPVSKSNWS
jgi:hypothetical protein